MSIPEGFKLVPVEPNEHQMKIARSMTMQQEQTVGAEYRAMVKAAPTPPQPIYDEAVAMVEYLLPLIDPMAFVAIRKADEFIARAKSVEVGRE